MWLRRVAQRVHTVGCVRWCRFGVAVGRAAHGWVALLFLPLNSALKRVEWAGVVYCTPSTCLCGGRLALCVFQQVRENGVGDGGAGTASTLVGVYAQVGRLFTFTSDTRCDV